MLRSLRSRWILASVLWTAGMLMLMHMFMMAVMHVFPAIRGTHSALRSSSASFSWQEGSSEYARA